jgi:hypothetical protein
MRLFIGQPNDRAPLSPFQSWPGCITNTPGYDFRKGQAIFDSDRLYFDYQVRMRQSPYLDLVLAGSAWQRIS